MLKNAMISIGRKSIYRFQQSKFCLYAFDFSLNNNNDKI